MNKKTPQNEDLDIRTIFKVSSLSITARVALFLLMFLFLPMVLTGICIENQMLLPGENMYLAIPIFFIPLIIPFSKLISYYLINRDLVRIDNFCDEVKKGNYSIYFDLPNQKEEEDSLITLLRNLTWMARNLALREDSSDDRFKKLRYDYGEMRKQAYTDPLTGLYNRRYLKRFASNLKSSSLTTTLSMIYADCDNFKEVNDTHGHNVGDELLKWLGTCLAEASRVSQDVPLRMGGDEFALLLPGTGAKEASLIAKRLRSLYHRKNVYNTTLSLGIANSTCKEKVDWPLIENLIQYADQQAYLVKKSGGDNIGMEDLFIEGESYSINNRRSTQRLADIDPLTGIPNRYLAKERFQQSLKRSRRSGLKLCLMFLDLDDFKSINETLGHHIGDKFLQHIVTCIKSSLRAEDSVCRLGGDEFLILMENIKNRDDVAALVSKIINSVRQKAVIDEQQVTVTSSIGITLVPDDGDDFDDLCKRGDIALSQAKETGKNNFSFFDPEVAETITESLSLITDLRSAIYLKQMELYFQPQVNLETGAIIGAESLIRWNHPEKGVLSPACFIPLAEQSRQIIELGEWIIDEACRKCAEWKSAGVRDVVIAINISPIQITRGSIARSILFALNKYGLEGSDIELEFTESLLLQNNETIEEDFRVLRNTGVSLAIDDFGTGYSNLNYLKAFEIGKLKIDRSFITDMISSKNDQAIVESIIMMTKSLMIKTVAEGIEDEQTLNLLHNLNCNIGQGFYWSRPLPEKQFLSYYKSMKTIPITGIIQLKKAVGA